MKHMIRAAFFDASTDTADRPAFIKQLQAEEVEAIFCGKCDKPALFDRSIDAGLGEAPAAIDVPAHHCIVLTADKDAIGAALGVKMKAVGLGTQQELPNAPVTAPDFASIDVCALLDTGRIKRLPVEPWTLTETDIEPGRTQYWETLFALTNGFMGLRGTYEERDSAVDSHACPGMYLNGIYEYKPYHYEWAFPGYPEHGHAMINVADWRLFELTVDGERFEPTTSQISDYRRQLNMKHGFVIRKLIWTTFSGKRIAIRTARIVSMPRRHVAAIRYEVEPIDGPVTVKIATTVEAQVPSNVLPTQPNEIVAQDNESAIDWFHCRTKTAPFEYGMAFGYSKDCEAQAGAGVVVRSVTLEAVPGRSAALDKFAAFTTSVETSPKILREDAYTELESAVAAGFDALLTEQSEWWAAFWEIGDVQIDGAADDQQAMRFNLFHLRQSHPEDDHRSIGANGITGDKYCGHVFWDTEMYMCPYFQFTEPDTVKPLLMYRYHILDRARDRARQMGHRGALYSWNSISGEECGVVFEASTAEFHLMADIAYGIWRYEDATQDHDFVDDFGAEILFETSRFYADLGDFVPARNKQFCINIVCGPDEYACGVNNNCYTNVMVQWHFRYAVAIRDAMRTRCPDKLDALMQRLNLSENEIAEWQRAADNMYVPFNNELGIHEQDDSYCALGPVDMAKIPKHTDIRDLMHPLNLWRTQVSKQADVVLLMFVHGDQFSLEQKRANYEYYEPRTNHGSSLSPCIHSIIAQEIGKPEEAYDFFHQSVMMDLNDFKGNTAAGVHSACLGGNWLAAVCGYGGMRHTATGIEFDPSLPEAWEKLQFAFRYRGATMAVAITRDAVCYRHVEGEEVRFVSGGEELVVCAAAPEVIQKLANA